jgi:hypothetical protein
MIIHYLSASRLKKYLQCTEAYHQAYENKVRGDAVHLRFGTMVHKVFERWFQEDKDILEIYEEEWRNHDVVDLQYYKDGIEMVKNFAEDTDKDNLTTLGYEFAFAINILDDVVVDTSGTDFNDYKQVKKFLKTLEEDDKPYIFGFIDRIDYNPNNDTLYIVDYKTSRMALTRDEASTDEQLSMYALVAQYLFPEQESVVLELNYVRLRDKVRTTRTPEELATFKDWLISMYHIIKNDVSPKATLNKYCGWCDAKAGCSAYQEAINTDVESEEEKEKVQREFPLLEEMTPEEMDTQLEKVNAFIKFLAGRKDEIEKKFKEDLRNSDNSPINVGSHERYVTNNARINYDISTVISLFPEEFEKLLSVKKAEVDKLAKGNPDIQQLLEETGERYYISPTLRKKKSK